jgi:FtsZ-binding cell division protein ZapB
MKMVDLKLGEIVKSAAQKKEEGKTVTNIKDQSCPYFQYHNHLKEAVKKFCASVKSLTGEDEQVKQLVEEKGEISALFILLRDFKEMMGKGSKAREESEEKNSDGASWELLMGGFVHNGGTMQEYFLIDSFVGQFGEDSEKVWSEYEGIIAMGLKAADRIRTKHAELEQIKEQKGELEMFFCALQKYSDEVYEELEGVQQGKNQWQQDCLKKIKDGFDRTKKALDDIKIKDIKEYLADKFLSDIHRQKYAQKEVHIEKIVDVEGPSNKIIKSNKTDE